MKLALKILAMISLALILGFLSFIGSIVLMFVTVDAPFYIAIVSVISLIILLVLAGILWGFIKKKPFYISVCICVALCVLSVIGLWGYNAYVDSFDTVGEGSGYELLEAYSPYSDNTKVATLDKASELRLTKDIPRMDGATALYPVYSAFAKAVYPEDYISNVRYGGIKESDNDVLCCTTTTTSYYRIVDGEADIIFVAGPSEEQEEYAAENGVELVYTPIGREAFVFFVNSQNPVHNMTLEDIQGIYSGEISNWRHFGISGLGRIKAFQRDEGSGSQTTLVRLMGDTPLMTPPKENVIPGMGGIIERTSDYRNYKNAIGYSFRFYSTEMVENNQIKLLSIDGVYPSIENIENGTYPVASEFYAVTRSDASENTKLLLEWIQGEQGQELIEKTGYTKLN